MPLLPILFLLFRASTAEPGERPLSVRQVMENADALDGHEITVAGWIEYCHRLSCPLFASRREVRRDRSDYWISIGRSAWFDAFAARNAPARVTLRARFDARCVVDPAEGVIAVCADRTDSLAPLAVVD